MSTKHTPGPWRLSVSGDAVIYGPDDLHAIGGKTFMHRTHPQAWANLRLAEAAPDLLDAARMVTTLRQLGGIMPGSREILMLAVEAADAAIARATGEQP